MRSNRFKCVACEIFYREVCLAVADSESVIDIEFITQGLHDIDSPQMCARLQNSIDSADPDKYSAVLLVYGLCNNGIVGLTASNIKVVVPRAHDCITIFLGSKERYLEYFRSKPGTYFKTTGWIERDRVNIETMPSTKLGRLGLEKTEQEYVELYGKDNARYIIETLGGGIENYSQYTYVEVGLKKDPDYAQATGDEASSKGWRYEKIDGNLRLIRNLLDGVWNEKDFLVVNPGQKIEASHTPKIIEAVNSDSSEHTVQD